MNCLCDMSVHVSNSVNNSLCVGFGFYNVFYGFMASWCVLSGAL